MTVEAPTLLEYASPPEGRDPWRPVLFKPSRPSLAFLLIFASAITWLALRHDPWRLTATIPADLSAGNPFTADNQLLVLDTHRGVNLYHPATGRLVRTVLPTLDTANFRYTIVKNGAQIIGLPLLNTGRILVIDTATGREVVNMQAPRAGGVNLWLPSPDGTRLITPGYGREGPITLESDSSSWLLWEIASKRSSQAPAPLRVLPNASRCQFSPDGSRILACATPQSEWMLLDTNSGDLIARETAPGNLTSFNFNRAGLFYVISRPRKFSFPSGVVQIFTTDRGQLTRKFDLSPYASASQCDLSDDGHYFSFPARGFAGASLQNVIDTSMGLDSGTSRRAGTVPLHFLSHSSRHLMFDGIAGSWAIYGVTGSQARAVLPDADQMWHPFHLSPQGNAIAFQSDSTLHLYRPAGWDCPESTLGLLAFPSTWLATLALFASTASLARDARRARAAAAMRIPPALLTTGLLVIAAILALHFALTAALGRWTLTPAPLLLLAGIGLMTHSRIWRVLTLWLLAASFPWTLYLLSQLYRAGPNRSSTFHLFDRYHEVPHLPPFVALALLGVLCALGILLLARARPEPSSD